METVRYTLSPKQRRGWQMLDDVRNTVILFDGGARCGKTDAVLLWLGVQLQLYPCEEGTRALVIRKHLDHALATIYYKSLRKLYSNLSGWRFVDSRHELRHIPTGGVIRVAGADDAERAEKVLGDEYAFIFANEGVQFSWDVLSTLRTRLSQPVPGLSQRLGDGKQVRKLAIDANPRGPRHHLHVAGVRHIDPITNKPLLDAEHWARLHWTPYDNPALPPDTMRTLESLTGVKRRRMLEGIWCTAEGAVYEDFDEEVHVVYEMPAGWQSWPRVRSIDFGYTNPFCCLWAALDPDGRIWVYRTRHRRMVTIPEHAEAIRAFRDGPVEWTVADPEDADGRAQLEAAGIPTVPANKAVSVGIQAVQARLRRAGDGRPRLLILDCEENGPLIDELQDYQWAPAKEDRPDREEPLKVNDHGCDALRYLVMRLDRPADPHTAAGAMERMSV
jgi:phage terminase large subunit